MCKRPKPAEDQSFEDGEQCLAFSIRGIAFNIREVETSYHRGEADEEESCEGG